MVTISTPEEQARPMLLEGFRIPGGRDNLARGRLLVAGGRIAALGAAAGRAAARLGTDRADLQGAWLVPGLVDVHTHGAVGVDFVTAGRAEFARAMRHYLKHGVTALLVSLYPTPWKPFLAVLERVAGFLRDGVGGGVARGIHLEGPFLSPERPGALPGRNFCLPSVGRAQALLAAGGGFVRTVTIAPELPGAAAVIRFLRRHGVVAAFGHSAADYEATKRAVAAGLSYATHLFNAMNGLHHRSPGAVTALLERPEVFVEVIGDGHHVAGPVLRLVRRLKPPESIVLVSDSVHLCGLRPGVYEFAGAEAILRGGRITLSDGTLAGSALTLDRALAFQVERLGTPLAEAVGFCTANPARAAGLADGCGELKVGGRADLLLLDDTLRVAATWLSGRLVHSPGSFGAH